MKKYLFILIIFYSCASLRHAFDSHVQVKLISWHLLPGRKAFLVATTNKGDTAYCRYGWDGRRPHFYPGEKITIFFDSATVQKNIWVSSKILINQ